MASSEIGELARLIEALRVADARVAAAEAQAAADREARAMAESKAAAAEEARDSAEEMRFVAELKAISTSASDATSHVNESRRDAPEPAVSTDTVLESFPVLDEGVVVTAWNNFRAAWGLRVPPSREPKGSEARDVHPVIECMLQACLASRPDLRLHHDKVVHDDIAVATAKPDFTVTHARDAQSSLLGAVFMVEVKLPGGIDDAEVQARAYGRRRVYKLFKEARARGDTGSAAGTVVAATDGSFLSLSRIDSGAPAPGKPWAGCTPCPCVSTERLELLAGWVEGAPPMLPVAPPAGFAALLQVLHAPTTAFSIEAALLESLAVAWLDPADADDGAPADVTLGSCIARGGTSDVYEVGGDGGGAGARDATASVIKVGRFTSVEMVNAYAAEAAALSALGGEGGAAAQGLVPKLLRRGLRQLSRHSDRPQAKKWPVLQLTPRGTPLESWLLSRAAARASDGVDSAVATSDGGLRDSSADEELADTLVGDVVAALACAHEKRIIHCDVRPSNVVVIGGAGGDGDDAADVAGRPRAVLVDWGVSREIGSACAGIGVAAFVDSAAFNNPGARARPSQDYSAAAYLWLCIARGQGSAPWLNGTMQTAAAVQRMRAEWLDKQLAAPFAASERTRKVVAAAISWSGASNTAVKQEAAQCFPRTLR